jgi:hypothetical protein
MAVFERFRRQCKHTKYFDCHIVLKDYTLLMIENDLPRLLLVNEDDVFYFNCIWEEFTIRDDGSIKDVGCYRKLSSEHDFGSTSGGREGYLPEMAFSTDIPHALHDKGVNAEIIEALFPQMLECYKGQMERALEEWVKDEGEERAENIRRRYLEEWEEDIGGLRQQIGLESGLSREDKVLYNQVTNLVCEFDWMIPAESDSFGEGMLCMIVWNTIQIVRNGGGAAEVRKHLGKYGRLVKENEVTYADIKDCEAVSEQKKFAIYMNSRNLEAAGKIVDLIRED